MKTKEDALESLKTMLTDISGDRLAAHGIRGITMSDKDLRLADVYTSSLELHLGNAQEAIEKAIKHMEDA